MRRSPQYPREPRVGDVRVEARTHRTLYYWPSACARVVNGDYGGAAPPAPGAEPRPCCARWLTRAQFDALRRLYAATEPPAHLQLARRCPGCGRGIVGRPGGRYCNGPCRLRLQARRDAARARLEPEPPPPFDAWELRPDLWRPANVPEHLTPDELALLAPRDFDDLRGPRYAPREGEGPGAYARRMTTLAALERSPGGLAAPQDPPTTSSCDACGGRWTAAQWAAANGACTWRDCPSHVSSTK